MADAGDAPDATPPTSPGAVLIALVPHDGEEPPASLSDREAEATWAAVTALWHPALLARAEGLPRSEPLGSPFAPSPGEVRVVPAGGLEALPSGYRTGAEDAGAAVIEGDADRHALARRLLERIEPGADAGDPADPIVGDFLALGTARWMLRDLTIGMGHVDCLDLASLARETLAAARAWRDGDRVGAANRLRASFELLTQARERFYPVDAYLVDLCLLDPGSPADGISAALDARAPFTFLAPARAMDTLATRDPEAVARLREAITEGWADVVGGAYSEVNEPFLPVESILWQFRRGGDAYRTHLDDRNVETLARRRFGLYPQLPQIARRFGFRFALHLALDAGRFPVPAEAKRLWEAPDGTYLETLVRPPLAADRPLTGLQLPWRLAKTMRDDHVATVVLAHWPSPVAGWYVDLRRVAALSPVLARWVTVGDYFHLTDRPFEMFRPGIDQYISPYLSQAAARRDPTPLSRGPDHARMRSRLDGARTVRAMAAALGDAGMLGEDPLSAAEEGLETGPVLSALEPVQAIERASSEALAGRVGIGAPTDRAGYLVINPLGVPRRAAVLLEDAAADLRPAGPLRVAQFTEEGVWAVVDLPAFGYAWVSRESPPDAPAAPMGALSVRGRTLKNELIEVEVDEASGGVRSFRAAGEPTARVGQQLVMTGLSGPDGAPAHAKMRAESFEVEYGGPALVQAVTAGILADPADGRPRARFRQRLRLWSGRPTLELDVQLSDIDPDWLDRAASADPWAHYVACRWAWPDPNAMLRRTSLLAPELTDAERPETPDALDLSTRRQRTALLFGGLAHHRRHGGRMLDTLLIAGRESARRFTLGIVPDLDHPFHAAADLIGPALVVPVAWGPPRPGPVGWFFHLDHKAVAVTAVTVRPPDEDRPGRALVFHLLETAGHAARCRLRLPVDPASARQTDFQGETILDLSVSGDAVQLDLTPHELARVEVQLD